MAWPAVLFHKIQPHTYAESSTTLFQPGLQAADAVYAEKGHAQVTQKDHKTTPKGESSSSNMSCFSMPC
jgi:hypothetical protein